LFVVESESESRWLRQAIMQVASLSSTVGYSCDVRPVA